MGARLTSVRLVGPALVWAVVGSWFESMKRVASDPLAAGFMTISNDPNGKRSFPKGATEIDTRTIKPKVKNFDKNMRRGVPGFNLFGAGSSVQQKDLPGIGGE